MEQIPSVKTEGMLIIIMIKIDCFDITKLAAPDYERLYKRASQERQARTDRYLRQEDKVRCICAEALLRNALGKNDYCLGYGEEGKPYLKDVEGFHFNISHSGRWVVIAYGSSPVGVDVQELRSGGLEGIAQRFFTAEEQAYVQTHPQGFFRIWTGKESYIKYLGTGLKTPLNSFSVLEDLGVNLFTNPLEDACLTLCTQEDWYSVTILENL